MGKLRVQNVCAPPPPPTTSRQGKTFQAPRALFQSVKTTPKHVVAPLQHGLSFLCPPPHLFRRGKTCPPSPHPVLNEGSLRQVSTVSQGRTSLQVEHPGWTGTRVLSGYRIKCNPLIKIPFIKISQIHV